MNLITHSSAVSHYNKHSHSHSFLMKLHPLPSSHSFRTHPMYLEPNSFNPPSRHSNPTMHRSKTHSHKVKIKAWTLMNLLNRLSANSRCSLVHLFIRQWLGYFRGVRVLLICFSMFHNSKISIQVYYINIYIYF